MKPKLFDIEAKDIVDDAPLIKPWKRISLDKDYAGAWLVAGDVDGDGQVEIVSARNLTIEDNHYTTSVIVFRLDGSVVWRWGDPSAGHNELGYDVACQIYDWDGDGKNEVIVAARDAVVHLDGATGKEIRRLPIPKDASDCISFANLSGQARSDILVKTRYGQIWAYDYDGRLLWTIDRPAGYNTAHQARPMDLDGDGHHAIMAGYALLNPDGTIRWDLRDSGLPLGPGHLDCARLVRRGKTPAESRIVFSGCADNFFAMLDGNGRVIWSHAGYHFQSIKVAKVCRDIPGQQIIIDVDHCPRGQSPTWLLSEDGKLLGQVGTDISRYHLDIDWDGSGISSVVIAQTRAMFNGSGKRTGVFDVPWRDKNTNIVCFKGDLTGNGVPDLVFHTDPANELFIFKNTHGRKIPGLHLGTEMNFTLY